VAWVHPDAGTRGYYRWRLPPAGLAALAAAAPDLPARDRIGVLGNAAGLLDAGVISGAAYLELLGAFAADPEPEVLRALLAGLDKVRDAFVTDALRDGFAAWVRATLGPSLERIGTSPRRGVEEAVALLRPRLLGWVGEAGRDPGVRALAARQARAYLADASAVDPSLVGTVLRLAARDGDLALFEAYRRRFEAAATPAERRLFLDALGAFEAEEVRTRALAYALEGPLRPTEIFRIPFTMVDSEAGADRAFAWLREHWEETASRMPPDLVPFLAYFGGGCSPQRLAVAEGFFAAPERQVRGMEEQLRKVGEAVGDCVALRRREGPAVAAWLARSGADAVEGAAQP
jgi:alanyl aminopeptidase